MKIPFAQQMVGQLAETIWHVDKTTVEKALLEYGANQRRNASEYLVK